MTDVGDSRRRRWAAAGWSAVTLAGILVVTLLVGDYLIGDLSLDEIPLALAFFSYAAVGAVLMVRAPGHRLGPLFAFIGLAPMFGAAVQVLGLRLVEPGSTPPGITTLMGEIFWNPTIVLALVLPALWFPTGYPPSRRWSWVGWAAIALAIGFALLIGLQPEFDTLDSNGQPVTVPNPIGIEGMPAEEDSLIADVGYVTLGILALLSLASLVVRYRRADAPSRTQLKWLLYAVALFVLWVVTLILFEGSEEWAIVQSNLVFALLLAGIPVTAAVAILRHRLFDIDVVISKTLVYGALAVFVTVVYVALVVGIGAVVGGSGNLVLSIVATAVVAVAFQPVRHWVQRLVNRVVYGERATPYEMLSELSGTPPTTPDDLHVRADWLAVHVEDDALNRCRRYELHGEVHRRTFLTRAYCHGRGARVVRCPRIVNRRLPMSLAARRRWRQRRRLCARSCRGGTLRPLNLRRRCQARRSTAERKSGID